tara:strand:+ start:3495 stop:4418 length:924 start_codon:yes stop_codon:yes gene_type:complete
LFPYYTFGVAATGSSLFASVSIGVDSYVIAMEISKDKKGQPILQARRILYQIETKYHNERIHQLHVDGCRLAIANTRKNSITIIDAKTGELLTDLYPFADFTGFPIHTDHNHINSVYIGKDCIIFTAHNGGEIGSIIGVIHGSQVYSYQFKNRGVHDIIPTHNGIIFSDTFGSSMSDFKGGGDLYNAGEWLIQKTEERGYMVRGVAGSADELLVGHSFMGKREDRFKGRGGILLFRKGKFQSDYQLPSAQINDIIRSDGSKHAHEWNDITGGEAKRLCEAALGEPCHVGQLSVQLPNVKEFTTGEWY